AAPQQLQRLAELVVRHRGERATLPDPLDGLPDGDPVVPDGVRISERVEEGTGRRPDRQCLPGRQQQDRGHPLSRATAWQKSPPGTTASSKGVRAPAKRPDGCGAMNA